MEKIIKIRTNDDHIIHWKINWEEQKKNKLIIFCHGLSWSMNEHHYFNAVPFFTKQGYDTFRFNFYCDKEKARQFSECSISIHAQDINTILDYFEWEYSEIYLVGHSLWAPAIMNADTKNVKKIIYWDPSKWLKDLEVNNITYDDKTWFYTLHRGLEFIANEKMIKEWKEVSDKENYAKRIKGNCAFVFAWNSGYYKLWTPYLQGYKIKIIDGASHVFTEEWTEKKLFENTLDLLEEE